jgi:hypothetical protein
MMKSWSGHNGKIWTLNNPHVEYSDSSYPPRVIHPLYMLYSITTSIQAVVRERWWKRAKKTWWRHEYCFIRRESSASCHGGTYDTDYGCVMLSNPCSVW